MILLDFPKAFGNIERDILWTKLYEAGIPIDFAQTLRIGHEGNILRPKCDGYIGNGGTNNKRVPHGSPMSATLFIIYAERMIEQYNTNLTQNIKNNQQTPRMNLIGQSINTNSAQILTNIKIALNLILITRTIQILRATP